MATVTRHLEVTRVSVTLTKEQAMAVYRLLMGGGEDSIKIRIANEGWVWDLADDLYSAATAA